MRKFLIRAHDLPTEFGFTLDNLPGNGRADLLARTVNAAFLTSHGVREDVELYISARDAAIRIRGSRVGGLNPDERSIAGVLQQAVPTYSDSWKESTPGVSSAKKSFREVLQELESPVVLGSGGEPIVESRPEDTTEFVLSDHRNFTEDEKELLSGFDTVSIGRDAVHADHAVSISNNWLDTDGYSSYR